jgi:hypothetical protein
VIALRDDKLRLMQEVNEEIQYSNRLAEELRGVGREPVKREARRKEGGS